MLTAAPAFTRLQSEVVETRSSVERLNTGQGQILSALDRLAERLRLWIAWADILQATKAFLKLLEP